MQSPEPVVIFLEDGSVCVSVGDQMGWVTSAHLIEAKARQLAAAWIRSQTPAASGAG